MPLLESAYRVIAPDFSEGDSDHPADCYDTQSLAIAVHGRLQQIGVERYVRAAHDVGAWVACPCAAPVGSEVRRLVLMDVGIPGITLPDALPTALGSLTARSSRGAMHGALGRAELSASLW